MPCSCRSLLPGARSIAVDGAAHAPFLSHPGQCLELLREAESRRPFYHYQNLYHDPEGAYDGPSIIPSPLALR